jgi:hypothetical protein
MKKILFLMMMVVIATTTMKAQLNYATVNVTNATLLQPAGSYIFYGDQMMNKKECVEFLSTRHQPAYEKFQSGMKCTKAGWWTLGAGLAVDLAGSLLVAYGPIKDNDAMFWSGASFIIAGGLAVLASIPTIYIGYGRMNQAIDMFNMSQVSAPQAYWTIQGGQNGIGLALHF